MRERDLKEIQEFNDRYFPQVNHKDRERYSMIYKFQGKEFIYDYKDSILDFIFKDDEEVEILGKNKAPWRVLDSFGLNKSNWDDKEARDGYLASVCDDLDAEVAGELAALKQEFAEKKQQQNQNKETITEDTTDDKILKLSRLNHIPDYTLEEMSDEEKKLLILNLTEQLKDPNFIEAFFNIVDADLAYKLAKAADIDLDEYTLEDDRA